MRIWRYFWLPDVKKYSLDENSLSIVFLTVPVFCLEKFKPVKITQMVSIALPNVNLETCSRQSIILEEQIGVWTAHQKVGDPVVYLTIVQNIYFRNFFHPHNGWFVYELLSDSFHGQKPGKLFICILYVCVRNTLNLTSRIPVDLLNPG